MTVRTRNKARRLTFDDLESRKLLSDTPTTSPTTPPPPTQTAPPPVYPNGGYDQVAIYDGGDTGGMGIASGSSFQEAADEYDTAIDVRSWQDTIDKLTQYVKDHGKMDYLAIFDHGLSPSYTQEIGGNVLTPERAAQLKPLLADDATILLAGCHVGANPTYCNSIATATGSQVVANDNLVQYEDRWFFQWDYYGDGTWHTYTGSEGGPTSPPDTAKPKP